MLMLNMLVLKIKKKQSIAIIHYKCELSLFGRDDTKQAKNLIFIVVYQAEQVPKVQKKNKQQQQQQQQQTKRDVIIT